MKDAASSGQPGRLHGIALAGAGSGADPRDALELEKVLQDRPRGCKCYHVVSILRDGRYAAFGG